MKDKSTVVRVALLHPKIRKEVETLIDKVEAGFGSNMAVRVVQSLRTIKEQNDLYNLGRTVRNPDGASASKPLGNIVTKARGGSSFHNYGVAIDFAILYDKDGNGTFETLSWDMVKDMDRDGQADWMEVVNTFKAAGYEWGGTWVSIKDNPHLQKTFGFSVSQLLAKVQAGKVDVNGYVLI